MTFRLSWELENRIILWKYAGVLSLDDLKNASQKAVGFIEQGQKPVHILSDIQEVTTVEYTLKEAADYILPYNVNALGWIVCFGEPGNTFQRFMTSALAQHRDMRIRWVTTKDEGRAFLAEVDETLPAYNPPPDIDGF